MISDKENNPLMPLESALPSIMRKDLKLLFALSRTPHGLIDMAAPALAMSP